MKEWKTIFADVVALDQVIIYNRLGATNPNGLIYALRRDVVVKDSTKPFGPGNVMLRPDKRPRPLATQGMSRPFEAARRRLRARRESHA